MHDLSRIRHARDRIAIQRKDHIRAIRIAHEGPIAASPGDVDPRASVQLFSADRFPHPDVFGDGRVVVHFGGFDGLAFPADAWCEFDAQRDGVGVGAAEAGLGNRGTR